MARIRLMAVTVGLLTFAFYMSGASRSYDYDSAVTVANFVATDSWMDTLDRQLVFNNHMLFSVLTRVVDLGVGIDDEAVLRLLPAAFAAATVGLVVAAVASTHGGLLGLVSGATLATNPLFFEAGRSVRGYSLMTFLLAAATLLVPRLRLADGRRATEPTLTAIAYTLLLAGAVATHLYAVLALAGHGIFLHAHGVLTSRWRVRLLAALTLGLVCWIGVLGQMLETRRPRRFDASFPSEMINVVGRPGLIAAAIGASVAVGSWRHRRSPAAKPLAASFLGLLALLWLVLKPIDLYPRFFVWLTPAVAIAAAVGLASARGRWRPALAAGAIVLAGVSAVRLTDGITTDPLALPQAATILEAKARLGEACVARFSRDPLMAYTRAIRTVSTADQARGCDVLVSVVPHLDRDLLVAVSETYSHSMQLPAAHPGVVLSKRPMGTLATVPRLH